MVGEQTSILSDFRYLSRQGWWWLDLLRRARNLTSRLVLVALLSFASYFLISHYIFQVFSVEGISMYPTLRNADTLYLNHWYYYFHNPKQSDIVVIRDPSDHGFAVKRIIAGPGDFVCVYQGELYVNGRKLIEPYLPADTWTFSASRSSTEWMTGCRANEYIVMGDNREYSLDSRFYGVVPRKNILGIVFH